LEPPGLGVYRLLRIEGRQVLKHREVRRASGAEIGILIFGEQFPNTERVQQYPLIGSEVGRTGTGEFVEARRTKGAPVPRDAGQCSVQQVVVTGIRVKERTVIGRGTR
jgi:hypothetical protein